MAHLSSHREFPNGSVALPVLLLLAGAAAQAAVFDVQAHGAARARSRTVGFQKPADILALLHGFSLAERAAMGL